MKQVIFAILGVISIITAVVLGLYMGVWWAFIGGIIQIVEAIKADPVSAVGIAFGIARVVFAAAIGWITFFIGAGLASLFFGASTITSSRKRRW